MAGGLDQFLANRLTASGTYQVVTNPSQADAILTDRIGPDFEERMKELYPPPPPPEESEKKEEEAEDRSVASLMGEASAARPVSSFSRSRGNVFLVDRTGERVIWSTYLRPRSTRPDELNRVADGIVDRLEDTVDKIVKQMRKQEARSVTPAPAVVPSAAPELAPPATPAPAPAQPATPTPAAAPVPTPTQPAAPDPAPTPAPQK
jgi:hypothetical protein